MDYDTLANAFANADQQPLRLRRATNAGTWKEVRLDGPDETIKVIFADLPIQDVGTLVEENSIVRVNRPTPGTGNRGGFGSPALNCSSFSYEPLTNLNEGALVASTASNLRADMFVGGNQLLVEIVICDTTSTGTSQHEMSIIDGRGGKTKLDLTLVVAEEQVDGGSIQWSPETGDRDNDGVDDSVDAFPDDPAASVDSDGDGYPDAWNSNAAEQQIADSSLVLDAFPNDPAEYLDSDGDGIGNIADADDDNDGYTDSEEAELGTNPLDAQSSPNSSPLVYDLKFSAKSDSAPTPITLSAFDRDFDDLSFVLTTGAHNGRITTNRAGTLEISVGMPVPQQIFYWPNAGFIGSDVLNVSVSDGVNSAVVGTVLVDAFKEFLDPPVVQYELLQGGDDIYFGQTMAFSGDGTTMVATMYKTPFLGHRKAQTFKRSDSGWDPAGPPFEFDQREISSLALSNNGETLAIGISNCSRTIPEKGKVLIFEVVDSQWVTKGEPLLGAREGDCYGSSVALNYNGAVLATGSPGPYGDVDPGSVNVYRYNGANWSPTGSVVQEDGNTRRFGYRVALTSDGKGLFASGPEECCDGSTGGIYSYKFRNNAWVTDVEPVYGDPNFNIDTNCRFPRLAPRWQRDNFYNGRVTRELPTRGRELEPDRKRPCRHWGCRRIFKSGVAVW